MEYCQHGSLEAHLKANRSYFVNIVQKGKLNEPKLLLTPEEYYVFDSGDTENYISGKAVIDTKSQDNNEMEFNINQLITWSIEIAEGMEYLSSKRVIHGDLSARNILLSLNYTTKISDFGLARKMYCYSQYTRNGNDPLPWRWLALESLKNLEFSTASDVWSYGILLWEIFTLSEQPYPGMASLTNNFIVNLEQGVRPTIPQYATSDCYNIMASCWDENPQRRPTFSQLMSNLKVVQDSYFDKEKLLQQEISFL
ncbi:unnamed protein product [Orchesella dallaii]|uniref:Protein kinase domain-containing protein n=1 Tax=Orchesella dallaii TaxID=48710 RepID=A0ABP1QZ50_9HEXA